MDNTKISFQTGSNASDIKDFEQQTGHKFVSSEAFKGKNNNHKFQPGELARLTGLTSVPQFNGEIVKISSIRENGQHGKAYYFQTDIKELADELNWVYEYRLETIKVET